ncbi:hypothetical protein CR513_62449, partial [Mucuna pruriens]
MSRLETNPHFSRSSRSENADGSEKPPYSFVPRQKHRGQPSTQGAAPIPAILRPEHEDHVPLHPQQDHFQPELEDHQQQPILQDPRRGKSPKRSPSKQPTSQGFRPVKPKVNFQEQPPLATPVLLPPDHPLEHWQQPRHDHRRRHGGLIVLIVYYVFRPQSPHFDVSSVTLNAAYLDLGYLLNADLTMLANFTNPNKKVQVDFSTVTIYLYYGSTLIASQYVEPFSAARLQSRFANIHMVSSQVQLPLRESQRLVKQMEGNGVLLEVRGVFRARSKLGSILRVMLTRPPDGILLKKKCRTKR